MSSMITTWSRTFITRAENKFLSQKVFDASTHILAIVIHIINNIFKLQFIVEFMFLLLFILQIIEEGSVVTHKNPAIKTIATIVTGVDVMN